MSRRALVRGGGVLVALTAAVVLPACERSTPPRPASAPSDAPPTVVVALADEPSGFNVHLPGQSTQAARDIVGRVWPSAYRKLPDGTYEPSLLSGPATVVSDDPFVVEWQIKAEAQWSDGTPVTADDFEYLWRRCSEPGAQAVCVEAADYGRIVAFERVDDQRVRTTFDAPVSDYEELFRFVPPAHVAGRRPGGWERGFDADPGASAGPFRFAEWRRGSAVTLIRNDWFGKRPAFERLQFTFTESGAFVDALRGGDADVAAVAPTLGVIDTLAEMPGVDLRFGAGPDLELLTFNLGHPMLADPAVRRAVALSVGRREVVESLVVPLHPGAEPVANRVLPAGYRGYEAHGETYGKRDLDAARTVLTEAGFSPTPEGLWARDGAVLEFRITTTSGVARRERMAQLVESQLLDAGIRVRIENVAEGSFDEVIEERDFDLLVWARPPSGSVVETARATYGCDGAENAAGLCDEDVDAALADASAAPDAGARNTLLNLVDQRLWEMLPDLPLYETPTVVAHDASIIGIELNPSDDGHLWNIETWTAPPRTLG